MLVTKSGLDDGDWPGDLVTSYGAVECELEPEPIVGPEPDELVTVVLVGVGVVVGSVGWWSGAMEVIGVQLELTMSQL